MTQRKNFYQRNVDVKQLIQKSSANELIVSLREHLKVISVIPEVKTEETLQGRRQYLSEETVNILLDIVNAFGDSQAKEVISLIAEQEYTLHHRICEKFNLFEYLVSNIDVVKELPDRSGIQLLAFSFREGSKHIYGKEVYSSFGTLGSGYRGFLNSLYSNIYTGDDIGVHFRYNVSTRAYKILELGKSLGAKKETLHALQQAAGDSNFLVNSKSDSVVTSYAGEQQFGEAFRNFVDELSVVITRENPSLKVSVFKMFANRWDVDTDYYISVEKVVNFHSDYEKLTTELIDTIKVFNHLEEKYFGFEYMTDGLIEHHKTHRQNELFQPLFG